MTEILWAMLWLTLRGALYALTGVCAIHVYKHVYDATRDSRESRLDREHLEEARELIGPLIFGCVLMHIFVVDNEYASLYPIAFAFVTWSIVVDTNMSPLLNTVDMFGALWAVYFALSQSNINVMCTEKHVYPRWAIIALIGIRITRGELKRSNTALIIYMVLYYMCF